MDIPAEGKGRIVRASNQISGDLDGMTMLMSIDNGEYYSMNAVGTRIWALLEEPRHPEEIVGVLMKEFEVDREVCAREVGAFVARLAERGLVVDSAAG